MSYSLSFSKRAFKALEKIDDPVYSRIKHAIKDLADNPRPRGYKKLTDRLGYRIRVGDYRVIYDIFDTILLVEVIDLGHRRDIYDQ